jgi:cytochrome c
MRRTNAWRGEIDSARPQRIACRLALMAIGAPGFALAVAGGASAADQASAQRQFAASCGTCHTAGAGEPHRQGPNLHGVYGRAAGALADFHYSDVLKGGGWVWDSAALDAWITNAQDAHPGTTMAYRQSDPDKRALVIEFLKGASAGGPDKP